MNKLNLNYKLLACVIATGLTSCASSDYTQYSKAQTDIATAKHNTEAEKYKAFAAIPCKPFNYFQFSMNIVQNYRVIVKKAWSVRFILLAILFSVVEIVLPMYAHTLNDGWFSTLSILSMIAAFIARLVAQKDVKCIQN